MSERVGRLEERTSGARTSRDASLPPRHRARYRNSPSTVSQHKTSSLAFSRSVLTSSSAPSLLRPLSPAIRSALRHLLVQHPTPVACACSHRPFDHSSTPHASLLLDSVRMPPKVVCGNPLFLKWLEGLLRSLLPDVPLAFLHPQLAPDMLPSLVSDRKQRQQAKPPTRAPSSSSRTKRLPRPCVSVRSRLTIQSRRDSSSGSGTPSSACSFAHSPCAPSRYES